MKKIMRMAAVLLAVLMLLPAAGAFAETGVLGEAQPEATPAPTPTPTPAAQASSGMGVLGALGAATPTPTSAPTSAQTSAPTSAPTSASASAKPARDGAGAKYVALTFDDGPSSSNTPKTLDMLKEYGVHATFFVLGSRVKGNEALLRRMVGEGHEIGSHGYSHTRLTSLSLASVEYELRRTNSLVYAACGVTPGLMRPPYGTRNARVLACLAEMGLPCVLWSIDPEDWKATSARAVREHVAARVKDGSIILMHDLRSVSVAAAELIIRDLQAKGYVFVTVSELLGGSAKAGATYSHG